MLMSLELTHTQRRIIELLAEDERTLTEITNKLEMSKPGALKQLKKMIESDIISKNLKTTEVGRESIYSLNDFTYFISLNPNTGSIIQFKSITEFKISLILLEQVEQSTFKNEIKKLFIRLDEIPFTILYGSVAKGEGTWKSDIDLLFLQGSWSKEEKENINDTISEVNMEIDHQISSEFKTFTNFRKTSYLIEEAKENGMVIYGELYQHPEIWQTIKRYKSITD